jgi:hypothetical protein
VGGDRAVLPLFAALRILERAAVSRHSAAERAPGDAVARLGQAGEGTLEAFDAGQDVLGGMRQSSNASCEVTDARSDIFPLCSNVEYPWFPSRREIPERRRRASPRRPRRRRSSRW